MSRKIITKCKVCGKPILQGESYCSVGQHEDVCMNCWEEYHWLELIEEVKQNKAFLFNGRVFGVDDDPNRYSIRIQLLDGTWKEGYYWDCGILPQKYHNLVSPNVLQVQIDKICFSAKN